MCATKTSEILTLEDYYVLHRLDAAELEQGIVDELAQNLKGLQKNVEKEISPVWPYPAGAGEGKRNRRLADLMADRASKVIRGYTEKFLPDLVDSLILIAQNEHGWQWQLYKSEYLDAAAARAAFGIAEVSWSKKLQKYADTSGIYSPLQSTDVAPLVFAPTIWDGKTIVNRLDYLEKSVRFELGNQITRAMGEGDDIKRMIQRVQPILGRYEYKAEIIARSETLRVMNHVGDDFLKANKKILIGVRCVGTLDDRTCILCGVFDGQTYYNDPSQGQSIDSAPIYPLHPRCRCTKIPLTNLWKKLGIGEPQRTRASIFGTTAASPSFDEFLRGLDKMGGKYGIVPRSVLGARYPLWKEGGVELKKFVSYSTRDGTAFGRIKTMKELKAEFGDQWWKPPEPPVPPPPRPPKPPKPPEPKKPVKPPKPEVKKRPSKKPPKKKPEPSGVKKPKDAAQAKLWAERELKRMEIETGDLRERFYKKPRKTDINRNGSGHSKKGKPLTKAEIERNALEYKYRAILDEMPDWSVDLLDRNNVQFSFRSHPSWAGSYYREFERKTLNLKTYDWQTFKNRPQVCVSSHISFAKEGYKVDTFLHEFSHAIDRELAKLRFPNATKGGIPGMKLRNEGWVRKWYNDENMFCSTCDPDWINLTRKNLMGMQKQMLDDLAANRGGFEFMTEWQKNSVKNALNSKFGFDSGYLGGASPETWRKFGFTEYGTSNPIERFAEMRGAYLRQPSQFAKHKELLGQLRKYEKWQIEQYYNVRGWELPHESVLDNMVKAWEKKKG